MFVELMPMLRNRSLTIIVMDAGEGKLKVNIVPKQLKEDENPSLSLPLAPQMIEGTPEEFDRDLPEALKQFVANHLTIADAVAKSTSEVEEVKKNADAAVKAAKDEASKKLKKNNVTAKTATPTSTPAPAPPPPPSLFDALGAAPEPAPAATTPASEPTATIVAQSDYDPEGNEDDDEGETEDAPLLAGAAA